MLLWTFKLPFFPPFFICLAKHLLPWRWWGWGPVDKQKQLQIISVQERQTHLIFTVPAAAAPPGSTVLLSVLTNSTSGVSRSPFLFPSFFFISISCSLSPWAPPSLRESWEIEQGPWERSDLFLGISRGASWINSQVGKHAHLSDYFISSMCGEERGRGCTENLQNRFHRLHHTPLWFKAGFQVCSWG